MQFGLEDSARLYQETLVPLMFAASAQRLVSGASLPAGARVLDVACGTGVVARAAAEAVGSSGHVTAIDAAAGMLAVARKQPQPSTAAPIEYIEALIEAAPLPAASFYAAFCQQGLQFFDEPVSALRSIRAALVPGGHLHLALWCALEDHPLASSVHHALTDAGLVEMTAFLHKVHRLHDAAAVTKLLEDAGFQLQGKEDVQLAPQGIWRALDSQRMMGATPLAQRLHELTAEQREALDAAFKRHMEAYARDGILELVFPATFYTARAA